MTFHGAEDPNVARIDYGKPFTAAHPRGPLGTDQTDPAHRRGRSFAALTNVEFITKPFVVPVAPLRLNIDVLHGTAALTRQAYVMVEALDAEGRAVPGFGREGSLAADINALDHVVAWANRSTVELAGRTMSLRVLLRDARLYSVHTREYVAPPLKRLVLRVADPSLAAWETSPFTLLGEAGDGSVVALDHRAVSLWVSHPQIVVARSDKRDLHQGWVTVYGDTVTDEGVMLQAGVTVGNRRVQSNPVALSVTPRAVQERHPGFKLLFLRADHLQDVQGTVTLVPNTLEYYADTNGLPTTPKAAVFFNQRIGDRYHVWGSSRGATGFLFRGVTTDGVRFTTEPLRCEAVAHDALDMAYNPVRQEYVLIERHRAPSRWIVHTSRDGLRFESRGGAYHDFDGIKPVWDRANQQFVAFQLSMQQLPSPRRYPDNLGAVVRLGNRARRVFFRRTSPDGLHWTPSDDVHQDDPTTYMAARYVAIAPDSQDPPDLECYWLNVFPYGDGYLGMVMWYAPAPPNFLDRFPYDPYPSKHGPHVTTEWIVSKDLVTWDRPFRGHPATRDLRLYFTHAPMELHDRLLFLASNQVYNYPPEGGARPGQSPELYSVAADRIVAASGKDGAVFSTQQFAMPTSPLHLNAKGSLAVEVVDEWAQVIAGFEKSKCVITRMSALHHRLRWAGRETAELANRRVRLRFHLWGAHVYSVHAGKETR